MVETHRELGDEIKAVIVGGYIDARLLNAQILFEWHWQYSSGWFFERNCFANTFFGIG